MKGLLFIASLMVFSIVAQAQCGVYNPADSAKYIKAGVWNWSVDELKNVAKEQYFRIFDMMHDTGKYDSVAFNRQLDRYDFWTTAVDLKLASKTRQDDFHNWLVAEARAAGKTK